MKPRIFHLLIACSLLAGPLPAQDPLRFEDQIQEFRDKDMQHPTPANAILFVGSSSIRGWNGMAEAFPDFDVINRGFGGSHFSDAIYWFDDLFFSHQPAAIFIYEGDNDLNSGKSTAQVLADAQSLIQRIKTTHPSVPIGLISPKPSIARWNLKETYEATNAALKALAETDSDLFFVDVWFPSLGSDGKPKPETFREDELHMNEKGYVIWQRAILDTLRAMKLLD